MEYIDAFEAKINEALHALLSERGRIDPMMKGIETLTGNMPDMEEKWQDIATAYLPDGIREFQGYPLVSLGWMMYVGMATAKMWDEDWQKALSLDNIYTHLRQLRGFDCMDEAIRQDILSLDGDTFKAEEKLVGDASQLVYGMILKENIEPSTPLAFQAYVKALHQMYLTGAASELLRLGYKMQKI